MGETDEQLQTEANSIAALAACHQAERRLGAGVPAFVLPGGYSVALLEHTLAHPVRKKGQTSVHDVASFIAVVNDQKSEATRIFGTIDPPTFTAVFNHHAIEAGWGDHRAQYNAPLSHEWKSWNRADRQTMSQVFMAAFIENNIEDIVEPAGAELLEICSTMDATKKVSFSSSLRLSDGYNQLSYEEDVQGSAQKGKFKVPEQFVIGIPVFQGGEKWRVDLRLRFRIADGGNLSMWMEMLRPHKVIEQAVKELHGKVAAETGLSILNGTPNAI